MATYLSPWPGTPAIRWMAAGSADAVSFTLDELAPEGIETLSDVQYREGDPDAQLDNEVTLHVDPNNLFLGGDSAGAQIASQMAAMAAMRTS